MGSHSFPRSHTDAMFNVIQRYDEDVTKHTLNFAQATYCMVKLDHFRCRTCDPDITLYRIITRESAKVLVGYSEKQHAIMVGFRGSSNVMNWVYDFKFTKVHPYKGLPGVSVEEGFYELHADLAPDVLGAINEVAKKYSVTRVFTTGHSLGGSLSTLLAFDLGVAGGFSVHNINFGSPRVGNSEFSDVYSSLVQNGGIAESFRVVHYNDIIPHAPFEWLMGFHHIPTEVWYNADSTHHTICSSSGEDRNCANSLLMYSPQAHLTYLNVSMGLMGC